jgi:hypothetical protein
MTVPFEILADMLCSGDPLERNDIYEGPYVYGDFPLYLPLSTFLLSGALRGGTELGTNLEAMRQIHTLCLLQSPPRVEYFRRLGRTTEEYSIVCSNPTADRAFFNSNRMAARTGHMGFKFLDTRFERESHAWSVFEQQHHKWMSDHEIAQELVNSLGLFHTAGGHGAWLQPCQNLDFVEPVFEARESENSGRSELVFCKVRITPTGPRHDHRAVPIG